ncbi:hypothetical protein BDZ91DRAFT_356815 [Kalaharituber pfeilii]|nr:hypothetical protein BDZ91DRAFT_356815 [Kalaharituber pfeilii]
MCDSLWLAACDTVIRLHDNRDSYIPLSGNRPQKLSRWTSLNELQNSLQKILEADDKRRRELPQLPMLRGDFSGMRILSMDDKKSGNKSEYSSLLPELPLSPEDYRNMDLFNIRRPTGIGAVEGIITRLQETETFYLFQALVKSFPCAPCLLDKAAPTVAVPRKHHVATDLPNSFTSTLFGQKLGPWRICLSEAAFKDVQSTNKEGHLNAIANKLRALASGHWDVSSLRKPLSQKMLEEAKEEQRVPLWRAEYASNGRILWQVNVGFDEDVGASCQIITVWRIGQKDES